jgi:hypothetical protein
MIDKEKIMKYKNDLITNSSSTSYIFLFNGSTKEDLFDNMKDMWREFEIGKESDDDYSRVNVNEVIDYIREHVRIISSEELIKNLKSIIKDLEKRKSEYPKNEWVLKEIKHQKSILNSVKESIEESGFESATYVDFHDNEGEKVGNLYGTGDHSFPDENLTVIKTGEKQ